MTDIRTMTWLDTYALGDAGMDTTHQEFLDKVNAMLTAEAADFDACLAAFAHHAQRHFTDEDRLMAETGYTNAACHVDEHRAVLASVTEVSALPPTRRLETGKRLALELARWFPGHLEVMDRGLADWLVKHRTGAAPLKFSRTISQGASQPPR